MVDGDIDGGDEEQDNTLHRRRRWLLLASDAAMTGKSVRSCSGTLRKSESFQAQEDRETQPIA